MVNADPTEEEGEDFLDLGEIAVVFGEGVEGVGVDVSNQIFFVLYVLVGEVEGMGLSLKSSLLKDRARCSHSRLLKEKTMTGL